MGKRKELRRSPGSRAAEALLQLPEGMLGHCTRMEWTDDRQVLVEGSCEILEYEQDQVFVRIAGGTVRFWGQELQLCCLAPGNILLTGRMQKVEFGEDGP